jgi:serine/threonine-protein phosphatase 4 regulatory subunit 1
MIQRVGRGGNCAVSQLLEDPTIVKEYFADGYKVVTSVVVLHLNALVADPDVDVRRSASESLAGLALQILKSDVATCILPIPTRLAQHEKPLKSKKGASSSEQDGFQEELRITASSLLAELAGAVEQGALGRELVCSNILPTVLSLCEDPSFRVRRSAAQALPRVLGGSTWELAKSKVVHAFTRLSQDEMYRVRKSTGECLVDMSRSFMILMEHECGNRVAIQEFRRSTLIPIAEQLLNDGNKFVRHGMMQFLGPFLASFFPFIDTSLPDVLPGSCEFDGSNHFGIGAQFFPHATSMVSRLNASTAATSATPIPIPALIEATLTQTTEIQQLLQRLPAFIRANRMSILSLKAVLAHRRKHPPDPIDLDAIASSTLLDYFCSLAKVKTGDDNTDAEMRVYCAYSFPAVVLLLGPGSWGSKLRECFLTLLNPSMGMTDDAGKDIPPPPLPVKRCLASSLHTVAQILGPSIALTDVVPIFREHFMRDTDDSVRINVIRIFPWLFSSLPISARQETLSWWSEIIRGEEVLGAKKRSSTNPLLLNWRQRDYVSRSIPDLLGMMDSLSIQKHLWPVIKILLADPICLVREDVIWSIPLILKAYCPENLNCFDDELAQSSSQSGVKLNKRWSAESCQEVVSWIKEVMLGVSPRGSLNRNVEKQGNFSQRQLYCQVCTAMALVLRFGEGDVLDDPDTDPSANLSLKIKSLLFFSDCSSEASPGPYQFLTTAERKHLRRLLLYDILPPALAMKEDRVTNVRLTLMKTLRLLPEDLRALGSIAEVIHDLEVEIETWESFVGVDDQSVASSSGVVKTKVIRRAGTLGSSAADIRLPGESTAEAEDTTSVESNNSVSRIVAKIERRSSGGSDADTSSSISQLERRSSGGSEKEEEGNASFARYERKSSGSSERGANAIDSRKKKHKEGSTKIETVVRGSIPEGIEIGDQLMASI